MSVSSVCVGVHVCAHVCVSGIRVQLCYWLNLQTGRQQQHPSAWAETLGPQALGWAPVSGQEEAPRPELLEAVVVYNIP